MNDTNWDIWRKQNTEYSTIVSYDDSRLLFSFFFVFLAAVAALRIFLCFSYLKNNKASLLFF